MGDLSITPSKVVPVTSTSVGNITVFIQGYSSQAINAGQMVYLKSNGLYGLTLSTDLGASVVVGMSIDTVPGPNQPMSIAVAGDVSLNNLAILAVGQVAVLGTAAGGVTVTQGDITSGWYPSLVGLAVGVNLLRLIIRTNNGIRLG